MNTRFPRFSVFTSHAETTDRLNKFLTMLEKQFNAIETPATTSSTPTVNPLANSAAGSGTLNPGGGGGGPSGTSQTLINNEVPSGAINGTNVTFTTAFTPIPGSEMLRRNGVGQEPGMDYTMVGNTITFATAPRNPGGTNPDTLRITYWIINP